MWVVYRDILPKSRGHPNTFNNWKFQNTKSYLKYLDQIADYLNVTPGYLIRGNSMGADVQNFSPLETKIINNISCLTINQQKILLNLIEEFKFANNPLRWDVLLCKCGFILKYADTYNPLEGKSNDRQYRQECIDEVYKMRIPRIPPGRGSPNSAGPVWHETGRRRYCSLPLLPKRYVSSRFIDFQKIIWLLFPLLMIFIMVELPLTDCRSVIPFCQTHWNS